MSELDDAGKRFVQEAVEFLESQSLVVRAADLLGKPVDTLQRKLPDNARKYIQQAVEKALRGSLKLAVVSLARDSEPLEAGAGLERRSRVTGIKHTAAAAGAGALGGLMGIMALPLELPAATTIMMRSIAAIAKDWGFDIRAPETQLECLYIFTLGSRSGLDDRMDSSYLTSRAVFGKMIRDAAQFMAAHGSREMLQSLHKQSAPVLMRLLGRVASSFELAVSEKVIAQSIPIVGAVGGAAINAAFSHHFARAARYHFGLLALEKRFGEEGVRREYQAHHQRLRRP